MNFLLLAAGLFWHPLGGAERAAARDGPRSLRGRPSGAGRGGRAERAGAAPLLGGGAGLSAAAKRSTRIGEHRGRSCRCNARQLPASRSALLDRDAGNRGVGLLARERLLRGGTSFPRGGAERRAQSGGPPSGPCFAQGRAAQQSPAPRRFSLRRHGARRRRGRDDFQHRGPPRPRRRRSVPPGHVNAGPACVSDASSLVGSLRAARMVNGPVMCRSGQTPSRATRPRRDLSARRADTPTFAARFARARTPCRERHPRAPCSSAT